MPGEALSAGWLPCPVGTAIEAIDLFEKLHPLVGLVLLDSFCRDESEYQELEALLSRTCGEMEWVGLVSPELADYPPIRELLVKYLYDYHTLPVDGPRLLTSLGHAHGMASLRSAPLLTCGIASTTHGCMIGDSPAMRRVFRQLEKLAAVDSSVMLRGESGTGKELAARIIFQRSQRHKGPVITSYSIHYTKLYEH